LRSLLDVNVLIALLDADHVSHEAATRWLARHVGSGWASCPITQNGCIRIMSHPRYASPVSPALVIERLAEACAGAAHEFWPDDVTLLDPATVDRSRLHGAAQTTDSYLLALAVHHGGRLATFDRGIAVSAVPGAGERNVVRL
jgi:toxin-antitoxin system PIN domain toxin